MTQSGFWRNLRQDNRVSLVGATDINRVWYLFPQGGGPRGAFTTFSNLKNNLKSRDVILLSGVLREQAIAPLGVLDVSIIGAANRPRQATNNSVPTGGGATWLAPASPVATTPLLELREQGWSIENVFFNGPADDACVKLHCEETATYPDASHFTARNCRFAGGLIGIEDYGGASDVLIEDCSFEDFEGVGGGAIVVTNQGVRIPSRWLVRGNKILPVVNGIVGAFVDSVFRDNTIAKSTTTTINLASGNTGLRNFVYMNVFNVDNAGFDPAGGFTGNATDTWVNYLSDAIDFGIPA